MLNVRHFVFAFLPVWIAGNAAAQSEAPRTDAAPTAQTLKKLPRKSGDRVAVTIYEFRSTLTEVSAHGATDMFKTALVQSGQFRVVERARLNEGVAREKQLQQSGYASGTAGQRQLRGAQYIFEGAVSEANASEREKSGAVGIAGMQVGGGTNRDTIAVDVRIVEAATGDIVDAISVKKSVQAETSSVSGIGGLVSTILAQRGVASPYVPDVSAQQQRREGVDSALREAINQAVIELSQRFAR